ncbi:rna-dependent rna polymerase [Xylariomycetidae sp. FL2044]|nr:rna-dependent rna polymerase [Xylariomycetidae sp. FL2044]
MAGIQIFASNIPAVLDTSDKLRLELDPLITVRLGIKDWDCERPTGKNFGFITFLHRSDGEKFLTVHSQQVVPGSIRHRSRLTLRGASVYCKQSDRMPSPLLIRCLEKKAEDRERPRDEDEDEETAAPDSTVVFELRNISCGHYEYPDHRNLAYTADMDWRFAGLAKFSRRTLVLTFRWPAGAFRVEMPYHIIKEIVLSDIPPALHITLLEAPRFFRDLSPKLEDQFKTMALYGSNTSTNGPSRERLDSLLHSSMAHGEIVGQSLVYRIEVSPVDYLPKRDHLTQKERLLFSYHDFPPIYSGRTYMADGLRSFHKKLLANAAKLPFEILFQLQSLVGNGYLLPHIVEQLMDVLLMFLDGRANKVDRDPQSGPGLDVEHGGASALPISAEAIKMLFSQIPFPGPNTEASVFSLEELWSYLKANEEEIRSGLTKTLLSSRAHLNLTMIFKIQVTPTRILLQGPEPEAKNRILRKFPNYTGFFARVQFCEEDGQDLYLNQKISLDHVYKRFKHILRSGINIAGRRYTFLGFSHSSLRAHAAWFMSPFFDPALTELQTSAVVISELGDFRKIYSPAKCAARIGQAFSETPFSIDLEALHASVEKVEDVKSPDGSRVFSDGVGTISRELMEALHEELPKKRSLPTCFQIRWAGAKGMLSLDSTLEGMVMRVRDSMLKFDSKDTTHLEICDTANKPIPLVLNRQMVKIMEDMGVPAKWFFKMQNREINHLRNITSNTDNTVLFLKRHKVAHHAHFYQFIRRLHQLGFDHRKDPFICSVIETMVLREVRLLKHKARIPIPKGVTLFGVMDEFGYLDEDEIFVTFDKLPGGESSLSLGDRWVLITRSPALHPGDIQIRRVAVPPQDHPLRELTNCVVFSQKGDRDLPSQLSGGDLDGDIYNIIWDDEAVNSDTLDFRPADYPKVTPLNIHREVTSEDILEFFVDFMATDHLGMIAIKHIILADQQAAGTVSEDCKKLAHLHSTAVDYSKTGIAVNMDELRTVATTRYRPDFLAPKPIANLKDRSEIVFDAPVAPAANDDEDDDEGPKHMYYKSDKILGELYRAIDEKKLWRRDIHLTRTAHGASLWDEILLYINKQYSEVGGKDWTREIAEARRIRQAYEHEIYNASIQFSDHPSRGITELEVFTGSVFNNTGVQTRRQRDKSSQLKDEFDRISKWITSLIRKLHSNSPVYNDDDDDSEDEHVNNSGDLSALELSIACLNIGTLPGKPIPGAKSGEGVYRSFKVIAASCALRELDVAIQRERIASGAALMGGGFPGVTGRKS